MPSSESGTPSEPLPNYRSLDDIELIQRITERHEGALSELYDRYSSMLLGLARRVLGNTQDAEEILQEVFVQAWVQASRYERRRASPSTWLVLITRSRAIDFLRSRRVRQRTADSVAKEPTSSHTSPEGVGAVLYGERQKRVLASLAELPETQREVLELAFYGGLTQRQIADRTGIPLGTVKTRTLLAMRKLRAALEDEVRDLL